MCLVLFVSFWLLPMIMALLESQSNRTLNGVSGRFPCNSCIDCLLFMTACIACASALYSASAVDIATGFGVNDAPSMIPPWCYNRYPPVLLPVSGQSCHDETTKKISGDSGLKSEFSLINS